MLFQAVALTIGALLGLLINKIATNYYGTEAKGIIIVFVVGIFLRIITAIFTSKIKDKNPPQKEDTNIVKEIITFRPVIYGVGELSKAFFTHQKNITRNVGEKSKHIHKNLHAAAKNIIDKTRRAIVRQKK